jgi:benzoyl-CoA reductase/2-hydroxyglutaryl-CoA dehydratase subunit BcrC/BadD/HgdB
MMKLETQFDIFSFYDRIKANGMPIAWCSAFAPAEALLAAGIMPVYPENHAAMLGALSPTRDPCKPYSLAAIDRTNAYGLKAPTVCSYALSDIGVLLGDVESPIHGLPGPDLFYACNSQCNVVERWGDQVQAICKERGQDVPHYVLRTPRLTKREEHTVEEKADFRNQMEEHIADICRRFGTTFSETKLREIVAESDKSNRLWQQCLELARKSSPEASPNARPTTSPSSTSSPIASKTTSRSSRRKRSAWSGTPSPSGRARTGSPSLPKSTTVSSSPAPTPTAGGSSSTPTTLWTASLIATSGTP